MMKVDLLKKNNCQIHYPAGHPGTNDPLMVSGTGNISNEAKPTQLGLLTVDRVNYRVFKAH